MTWNGDILRMTRRAAGKTQEELVEALGGKITQAALSRYEASLREPESEEVVESLARALGVTARYLRAGERTFPMVSATAHMRRQLTASPATWKDLEARLNVTRIHWDLLVDSVDISPDFEIPTFDGTADLTAADAAVYVRERWRMPLGPV